MKIKHVVFETDSGAEVTLRLDEVDNFMKAMRRLKKSCEEPKEVSDQSRRILELQEELQRLHTMILGGQLSYQAPLTSEAYTVTAFGTSLSNSPFSLLDGSAR